MALTNFLKDIADAIRYAEGSSGEINAQKFAERIRALQGGQPIPPTPIRPTVPSGTWQLKNTTDKRFVIIGTDDDNIGNPKFFRMLRTYGFPYSMNTSASSLNRNLGNDVDDMFTENDAPSLFPNGVTVADLGKYLHDSNLGEVAQHGGKILWDSSKLVGDYLDTKYADYVSKGGLKTKEEFTNAVKENLASSDIAQGASYVADSRALLEDGLGFFVNTVGCWGGSAIAQVDGIDVGLGAIISNNYDWKADNYLVATPKVGMWSPNNKSTYDICRCTNDVFTFDETLEKIMSIPCGHVIDLYWHMPFHDHSNIDDWRALFTELKDSVDSGKVSVVTKEQYYNLGEFVDNPITKITMSRDGAIEVGTTDDKSKYTVTATYEDGTTANVSAEAIIDNSGVNTEVADTYTVTATYRGFNVAITVTVVGGGITYPEGLKDKDYWFVCNDTTKNKIIAINTSGTITTLKNYDSGFATSGPAWSGTNGKANGWSSADGGQTWTQELTNYQHYQNMSLSAMSSVEKGDNLTMIEYSNNFSIMYFK